MFITYKGSQSAMHIEVGGRYFRLVPSQPVELTKTQADKLQSRKLMQVLVEAGELEFSERTKPLEPSTDQTDEGLQAGTVAEPEQKPEVAPTTEPEPALNAVADDVVSDPMPEQSSDVAVVEPDTTPEIVDAEIVIEPETVETVESTQEDAATDTEINTEPVLDAMPELDNTSSTESVAEKIEQPVSDMTVSELKAYITENGGSYASGDNKPELLVIAQDIENAKQ